MIISSMTSIYGKQRGSDELITTVESIRRHHALGFRVLDLSLNPLMRNEGEFAKDDWKEQAFALKAEAERLGITFYQAHLPFRSRLFPHEDAAEVQKLLDMTMRAVEIAGIEHVKWAVVHPIEDIHAPAECYSEHILANHEWNTVPMTYRNSFSSALFAPGMKTSLLVRQREIIEDIARAGNDCIIVGRDADIILSEYRPFRIFVCAEMQSRIDRCMKHEQKKEPADRLTEKEITKNIRQIDKGRSQVRELLTGLTWGDSSAFDLTVNSSGWEIRELAPAICEFALKWFQR